MRGAALLFYEKEENMIMKMKRAAASALTALAIGVLCCVPAFAADGDVAGAVAQTWTDASAQIKTVVDNVVFPALSMVLAIAFFAKLAMAYFDCAPVAAM